jgi:IS30 family transposase
MRRLSESEKFEIWDRLEAGESLRSISRRLGRPPSTIRTHVVSLRFRRPMPALEWSPRRLSLAEREEISRGLAAEESLRGIARRLGRAASTVSREVAGNGGRRKYRAWGGASSVAAPSPASETSQARHPSAGSRPSSRRNSSCGGHHARSRGGSLRHTLQMRRCG